MADPNNVKSIFLAASEKPAAERSAFLEQAVGGDSALRVRVEALLKAHDNPDSFLKEAAAEFGATIDLSPAELPLAERPGTLIGPYKLLEQIGEGGMGVVYMADQQAPVRRRVALKIIKAGMDTRQVIARFEAERQALALMDHSNIARVLDAGATNTGRPYFVMELVKGVPITEYCDKNNHNIPQRLELFAQVCQAVQHAHQKGLIHRDIKPTNVLVSTQDDRPIAKVIDFGVAKATQARLTEKTLFTEFQHLVGTPAYMSPEQAEGELDIDTRSDVYSLGVLLYELLAGSPPFDPKALRSKAFAEMQRIIREVEPQTPSSRLSILNETMPSVAAQRASEPGKLAAMVRGELDWIVMRCLEKDRKRRYQSASSLAEDIQRYLSDQPVQARPATLTYRLKKFARRNKVGVLAGSAVLAAIAIGLTLAAIGFIQAHRQAEVARTEAMQATRMTQRATQVQQFLQEMLTSVNPEAQIGAPVTVQKMLDQVGEKIDPSFANQPDVRAVLHETIGQTYYGLHLYAPAATHLSSAVELRRQYLPEEKLELANALLNLAQCQAVSASNIESALANCRAAATIFDANAPQTDFRRAIAHALEAHLTSEAAGGPEAQIWSAAALPLLTLLSDEQVARLPSGFGGAIAEAKRLLNAGDRAGAGAALRRWHLVAMERVQKLCADGDLAGLRQFEREHLAPLLEVPWGRHLITLGGINRVRRMRQLGEHPLLIEALLREVIDIGHTVWGTDHPHIASAYHELAELLREQDKLEEGETAARAAFAMRQKVLGGDNPETAKSLDVLVDILQKEGKSAEAVKFRGEAVKANGVEPKVQ